MNAQIRGDVGAVYRIARDGYRHNASTEGRLLTGVYAYNTNRPREAVETLRAESEGGVTRTQWLSFHETLTGALHVLAEYEEELEAAREARDRFPDDLGPVFWEARALVGMGRIEEALSLVEQGQTLASRNPSPADLQIQTGLQLRGHGYLDAGNRLLRRALEWYRAESHDAEHRFSLARAYLWLEQPDSSLPLFRELAARDPAALEFNGYLGLALASAGQKEEARQADSILAEWSEPYLAGRHLYWRAAIAARLGEYERSMTLLRESLSRGVVYPVLHENEDLRPLWGYEPFQQLLEPRGDP
jgi:hypothetical protein